MDFSSLQGKPFRRYRAVELWSEGEDMSLSNPQDSQPNPATRWFDWNGEHGEVTFYDKAAKKNITVPQPFTFIVLDELSSVRGWHDLSQSGIYSNEIRDTRSEIMTVKAFKGGILAEGIYRDIRDRISAAGGHYSANCYLAFKTEDGSMAIGVIRFKGAALAAWMEFKKQNRKEFYEKAITINGFTEGKKGRIVFRVPKFSITTISPATLSICVDLDKELQAFLKGYLARNKHDQAEAISTEEPPPERFSVPEIEDSEIPF